MLAEKQDNLQRVLVIQDGSRQDLMLTIPALQKLRQLLADKVLTLMVSTTGRELGLQIPWADNILIYEAANYNFRDAKYELALIAKLRQFAFDASVIFTNPRSSPYALAYICYLAGIPIRISQSQEFGGGVLSHCVKPQQLQCQYSIELNLEKLLTIPNTVSDGMQQNVFDLQSSHYESINYHLFLVESVFRY